MSTWLELALTPPVVSRALRIAAVVGTILVAIDQGEVIITGGLTTKTALQIALTYMVPYLVSTYAAVEALRASKSQPK